MKRWSPLKHICQMPISCLMMKRKRRWRHAASKSPNFMKHGSTQRWKKRRLIILCRLIGITGLQKGCRTLWLPRQRISYPLLYKTGQPGYRQMWAGVLGKVSPRKKTKRNYKSLSAICKPLPRALQLSPVPQKGQRGAPLNYLASRYHAPFPISRHSQTRWHNRFQWFIGHWKKALC